ncbi:MAG: FecR family protein [Chitinophagaceae bacterium]
MEDLKIRLAILMDKSEWTEEDKKWLLNYLENTGSQELNSLLLEEFNKRNEPAEKLDPHISRQMLNNIHEKIGVGKTVIKAPVFSLWPRRITAAAVIILCMAGSYLAITTNWEKDFVKIHNGGKSPNTKKFKNDVPPGGNKAVLTLADGSTIVLDEARNGTLAQQGKTQVLKFDGKLAYNNAKTGVEEILYNTIATPRGGQFQVVLPDGSHVWLNAASSLRFPTSFTGKERRVEITGEAYFEVTKNANLPFVVQLNTAEIKVLGTHFNIMAYNEENLLKTTLLEGSVQCTSGDNLAILKPGQQSQLMNSGHVKILNNVDLEEVVAWKNGMFHFEKMDIETLMRQISRWYDVEVVYQNHKSVDKFIADIPRNTNLSDALKALELTGKVRFDVEGKKVIVK